MKIKIKAKTAFEMAGALVDGMSDEDRLAFAEQLLVRLPRDDLARLERCIPAWQTSPEILDVLRDRARAAMRELAEDKARAIMTKGRQSVASRLASVSGAATGAGSEEKAVEPQCRSPRTRAQRSEPRR